ncbi:MAG: hypothetical protein WBE18_02255 [Gammaproteobacteria bacterium]
MNRAIKIKLILLTPLLILLAHYLAMLPHEYAHSFMAWLLGYKSNPLALTYGGTSWLNLLLLAHMDENVNYSMIFSAGHGYHVALIAFAGAGIANGLMFILSLWLLTKQSIRQHAYLYYFLFLFNLMNIGNLYAYVPIRTFTTHGDAVHFETGLGISPWWVYAFGGYIVAFLIWHFFTKTMIAAFTTLEIKSTSFRAGLMMICVAILFGFFGMPGFFNYGDISYFLSATSLLAIPGLVVALWPTREWVTSAIKNQHSLDTATSIFIKK